MIGFHNEKPISEKSDINHCRKRFKDINIEQKHKIRIDWRWSKKIRAQTFDSVIYWCVKRKHMQIRCFTTMELKVLVAGKGCNTKPHLQLCAYEPTHISTLILYTYIVYLMYICIVVVLSSPAPSPERSQWLHDDIARDGRICKRILVMHIYKNTSSSCRYVTLFSLTSSLSLDPLSSVSWTWIVYYSFNNNHIKMLMRWEKMLFFVSLSLVALGFYK